MNLDNKIKSIARNQDFTRKSKSNSGGNINKLDLKCESTKL